jgi:hypothetical protein
MNDYELRSTVEAEIPGIAAAGWQIDQIICRLRAARDVDAEKRKILSEKTVGGMINRQTLPKVVNFIAARINR